jgi:CelD/BcsL family acetyltransferase involved in cellulose biosynthesis
VIGLSIAGAVERGVKFYDLLRGAEPYKFDWANETRATFAVQVASNSLPARLTVMYDRVAEAARATAHTLLPAGALAFWRRRRQARMRRSMLDAGAKGLSANEEKRRDKAVELVSSVLVSSILLSLFCL